MSSSSSAHLLAPSDLYIGIMSGTSLDGVDAALARFEDGQLKQTLGKVQLPFPAELRAEFMDLQAAGENEIEREAHAANRLADLYGQAVKLLLAQTGKSAKDVRAIGAHGQTIRHRPELGYTVQSNNPALLAELTGIDVVAELRTRDIAAGGQGAPLVPAFHQAAFGKAGSCRVLVNIGGIANISVLQDESVLGFDTGPGNVLQDLWIARHQGRAYDAAGAWAAGGKLLPTLLDTLLAEPYLHLPPPKSTGRDLFHAEWLDHQLQQVHGAADPQDVQRTLCEYTAISIADAIRRHAPRAESVHVCGGGAFNDFLMHRLSELLQPLSVASTIELGIAPDAVEALAFAWLGYRFLQRQPGNLPSVTGARGPRILGALFPA